MQSAETFEHDKASALDAFDAALREMQKPSNAVIAEAVRELFKVAKKNAAEAKAVAEQHQAELSEAFHAFLTLHDDTPAFAKLKADKGRLLRLASETETGNE
ncbi:hypothetical protein JCM17844_17930 [Iodidimonas gelatinilytica]|uniref:Uncharacterized protein n=1 Tax=Iodidimonas gelatinilytica TaxID=1236966 RepID=A0A5A7MQT3_9PROT|nr:hypothetical protein [Iodidimonas gelatinilytica]GEQ98156.1 hypothetical protein JCM17844_17930 [Iodidimonas gelatinilytica]